MKKKNLKIAVSGSHGTGKTTLVNQLAELYGLPIVGEKARGLHSLGFGLNQDASLRTQLLMLVQQIRDEHSHKGFVADRTLLDCLAYCASSVSLIDELDKALAREFRAYVYELMRLRYDVIFYLPICFDLVGDEARPADVEYQKKIDKALRREFECANISFVELPGKKRKLMHARSLIDIWWK